MSTAHKKHARLFCILPAAVVLSVVAFASASESRPAPGASSPTKPAKYEPPDGTTYHGVCLPGYWRGEEFAANLAQYRAAVGNHPLPVLHSWFAHCQELFDVIEATPQIKAICWFQWGKEWNVERDAGQLAEYQRRLQAARYSVPFAGTKP